MNRRLETLDRLALGFWGASILATAWVYPRLPDPMPTHFDAHSTPDGFMPRAAGAWLLPVIALLAWALVRFGHHLLRREWGERLKDSPRPSVALMIAGLLSALQGFVLRAALAPEPRLGNGIWAALGVFFVLLGQVMPRVRRNPFIGVRTAWALTSDENWARTHRFAGYTMTTGGLLSVAAALAGAPVLGLVFIVGGAVAPALYSWRLSRLV